MRRRFHPGRLAMLLVFCALAWVAVAQNPARSKRLVLKDGSYQPATQWEIKGDRVRYYSAERHEWEEVPKNLVDWAATEKWDRERQSGELPEETRELSAELEAERQAELAKTPTVAPGLKLPATGGVFLLDRYNGQPQLAELAQSGSEIKKEMGKNILRAAINPFASARQSIELKGARSGVQAHERRPVLYVNVESEQDPSASPSVDVARRFRLVRLQQKKDSRQVGNLKIAITGKVKEQQNFVETVSQPFSGPWLKVTTAADLEPGEYALVEMLGEKQMNLYVWDFGVDPTAPANRTAWKPVQPAANQTGASERPELGKRE